MSCDGHYAHHFESTDDCRACGHDRSEHDEDGFWPDDRGHPRPEPPQPGDENREGDPAFNGAFDRW